MSPVAESAAIDLPGALAGLARVIAADPAAASDLSPTFLLLAESLALLRLAERQGDSADRPRSAKYRAKLQRLARVITQVQRCSADGRDVHMVVRERLGLSRATFYRQMRHAAKEGLLSHESRETVSTA